MDSQRIFFIEMEHNNELAKKWNYNNMAWTSGWPDVFLAQFAWNTEKLQLLHSGKDRIDFPQRPLGPYVQIRCTYVIEE